MYFLQLRGFQGPKVWSRCQVLRVSGWVVEDAFLTIYRTLYQHKAKLKEFGITLTLNWKPFYDKALLLSEITSFIWALICHTIKQQQLFGTAVSSSVYFLFYTIWTFCTSWHKSRVGSQEWLSLLANFCNFITELWKRDLSATSDFFSSVSVWYLSCGRAITISFTSPSIPMLYSSGNKVWRSLRTWSLRVVLRHTKLRMNTPERDE